GGDRLQDPTQHLRSRQGEQQGNRQFGGGRLVEDNLQFGATGIQAQQPAAAHVTAEQTHPQCLAGFGAMDLLQVRQAPIPQDHPVVSDEVRRLQQQQVHWRETGGWLRSGLSSSASPRKFASRLLIMLPQITPASNSSHMGTASRVWENTSGGVSTMPTPKQPTIT